MFLLVHKLSFLAFDHTYWAFLYLQYVYLFMFYYIRVHVFLYYNELLSFWL